MPMHRFYFFAVILLFSYGCKKEEPPKPVQTTTPAVATVPVLGYEIVTTYPHDKEAFTEGLQYYNGFLYESTGLNGQSHLRKVDLKTGKVLQNIDLANEYFGEGITILGSKIYQLTYQTQVGFVYDLKTFKQLRQWNYQGEGWSLTNDGTNLIMSNGTDKIQYLDPNSLSTVKTIDITSDGMPVLYINELEYINGEIWANIWRTDRIARIDPATGNVKAWLDMRGLLTSAELQSQNIDVLNGIAYDSEHDRVFVTGKNWPKLFEIKIRQQPL
jgi:glutaminyl-peptide cyclotransferase